MANKKLIPTVIKKMWEENLESKKVIGILSNTSYQGELKSGDEADVKFNIEPDVTAWDGGDLTAAQEAKSTIVKIKVDKGSQVNFKVNKADAIQMEGASNAEAMKLASKTSDSAIEKVAEAQDQALGKLYATAGIQVNTISGAATALTAANIAKVFTVAKAKMSDGNAWVDGKMAAIISPEMTALLNEAYNQTATEYDAKNRRKGFVRTLFGFDIYESNNLFKDTDGNVYPLFGVKGETLASVTQNDLDLMHYIPENSLDDAYKGGAVWGCGNPRPDKLATGKFSVTLSV